MMCYWRAAYCVVFFLQQLIVFVVPTVPLVTQQANHLKRDTALRVRTYRGDMNVDMWKKDRWSEELESADVVVLTGQVVPFPHQYVIDLWITIFILTRAKNRFSSIFFTRRIGRSIESRSSCLMKHTTRRKIILTIGYGKTRRELIS
jgi:hypothetical protein